MEKIVIRPRQIIKVTVIAYLTVAVMESLAKQLLGSGVIKKASVWLEAESE